MNIAQALDCGAGILGNCNGLNPEARILLGAAIDRRREFLVAHPEFEIDAAGLRRFKKFCAKRKNHMPVSYITARKEFFGLDFYVDERVLIPRPETELLVEAIIKISLEMSGQNINICDVGTGSGCIAVALAKNIPNCSIVALDISRPALNVARKNAKANGVSNKIKFVRSDLLAAVTDCEIDILTANLPYVSEAEYHLLEPEVADYEPRQALYGGADGLAQFESLFKQIKAMKNRPNRPSRGEVRLRPDAVPRQGRPTGLLPSAKRRASMYLVAEMGFAQKKLLKKLAGKYFNNARIEWKKDLAGLDRFFIAANLAAAN